MSTTCPHPRTTSSWPSTRRLSEWRITIDVSKSTAIIFMRAGWCFIQPRPVTLFGEPIEWVDTTRYLGVNLDTQLTWSPHIDQVRKRTAQRMGMLGPILKRKSDLFVRNGVVLYKQLIRSLMDYAFPRRGTLPAPMSGGYRCYNPSVFASLWCPLVRK